MRIYWLYATSVICGFCLMALEIVGPRYLAPRFGTSVDVWAAIITVFILSLSVGYWLGGRIADHSRSNRPLAFIILSAAACFLVLPAIATPVVQAFGPTIAAARWGSLVGALALFLIPSVLLGCITPMLVKLVFVGAAKVGRTTGTLYAISSVGNVLGILVTNYFLLELATLNANTWAMGLVLAALGTAHLLLPLSGSSEQSVEAQVLSAGVA